MTDDLHSKHKTITGGTPAEVARSIDAPGHYPHGRLDATDMGSLGLAIETNRVEKRINLHFGREVDYITMSEENCHALIAALREAMASLE